MSVQTNPFATWADLTLQMFTELNPIEYRKLSAERERVEEKITADRNEWVAEQLKAE